MTRFSYIGHAFSRVLPVSTKSFCQFRLAKVSTTLKISQRLDCLDFMLLCILCDASSLVVLRIIKANLSLIIIRVSSGFQPMSYLDVVSAYKDCIQVVFSRL
jgi:hypothetical protein